MAKFIKVQSTDGDYINEVRINIENIGAYKENNANPVGSQINLNIDKSDGSPIVIQVVETPDEIDAMIIDAQEH